MIIIQNTATELEPNFIIHKMIHIYKVTLNRSSSSLLLTKLLNKSYNVRYPQGRNYDWLLIIPVPL